MSSTNGRTPRTWALLRASRTPSRALEIHVVHLFKEPRLLACGQLRQEVWHRRAPCLVKAVPAELRVQLSARQAQELRGLGLVESHGRECFFDHGALDRFQIGVLLR